MGLKELEMKVQNALAHFLHRLLQVATSFAVSVFVSHLLQQVFHFGILSYIFCLLVFSGCIFFYVRNWSITTLAIFNVIYSLVLVVLYNFSGVI
jgi:hypothetical protein